MKTYNQILEVVKSAHEDVEKFYTKGNVQAGKRVRKYMQDLRILAKQMRDEIQDLRKGLDLREKK
jgi:hypothetical protein